MYLPRMATELKQYISKCDVCMTYRAMPSKEPIQQHEFTPHSWTKVGADLCDGNGRTRLVVCDYFSNFIEVETLQSITTRGVSRALKGLFARYRVPDTLVTDNGPQFSSTEFLTFSKVWGFHHVTSSPCYPQSNGKAENAVKIVKRLFSKCRAVGQSEVRALLDWKNTPTVEIGTSPAQRFLERRCRTQLLLTETQLKPAFPTNADNRALQGQKARQQRYYNRHALELPPISAGEAVRMRLPAEKK